MSEKWKSLADIQTTSRSLLGNAVIDRKELSAPEYSELKGILREHPLLFTSQFRLPYNINNSQSLIDLERIQLDERRLRIVGALSHVSGHVVSQYYGGGSQYEDNINDDGSQGGLLAATSAGTKKTEDAESARSELLFSPVLLGQHIRSGFGKPIIKHELNRTAINERVGELADNPGSTKTDDEAWAIALDESLKKSIGPKIGNLSTTGRPFLNLIQIGDIALSIKNHDVPASYLVVYAMGLLAMMGMVHITNGVGKQIDAGLKLGDDVMESMGIPRDAENDISVMPYFREAMSPREWRFSLFTPMAQHWDSFFAAMAVMNSGKLIRYRK